MCGFEQFIRDESGVVTVDWVALTGGLVMLGLAVVYSIYGTGATPLVMTVSDTLSSHTTNVTIPSTPVIN